MMIRDYLQTAKEMKIIPNFWLTEEYLNIQDITVKNNRRFIWIEEGEQALFPPLPKIGKTITQANFSSLSIWSDFVNYRLGEITDFLDWEYTYDSKNFNTMTGKKWAVFRKNSRKWPKERDWEYTLTPKDEGQITRLFIDWLMNKIGENIEDDETMHWFIFNGSLRGFLYEKGKLMGINVWDTNDPYIIFRYCITDPKESWLNEFMRLLFYQSQPNKIVIDGGILGNPGLEKFKDKLNPIRKRPVYSRIIK